MKNLKLKHTKLCLTLLTSLLLGLDAHARDASSKSYDFAFIKTAKHGSTYNRNLHLFVKSNDEKQINFNGKIILPRTVQITSAFVDKYGKVTLSFDDNNSCEYIYKKRALLLLGLYELDQCTLGTKENETIRVNKNIKLKFSSNQKYHATAFTSVKVLERFVKGLKIPSLEADAGQILKFDGEMWVPSDYIPDGTNNGDVLTWNGSQWVASKLESIKGDKGDKGDRGETGAQGATGPQGLQGPQGIAGVNGLNGAKGDKGDKGEKGDRGETGAQGPQGLQGIAGANGLNGAKGDKGDKGDKGEKGDQGDPGIVKLTAGIGILNGTGLGGTILGNGGVIAVNIGTNAGQIPILGEDAKLSTDVLPSQSSKIVIVKDVKPNGTAGGGCDSAGVWYTRALNQISGEGSFADLNNNQVALSVGKYLIEATAPAYLNNIHKAVLVNASTNAVLLAGSNGRSHVTAGGSDASVISGVIELSNDTILEIRHRCSVAKAVDGFGVAAGFGISEVYTQLKITKID